MKSASRNHTKKLIYHKDVEDDVFLKHIVLKYPISLARAVVTVCATIPARQRILLYRNLFV